MSKKNRAPAGEHQAYLGLGGNLDGSLQAMQQAAALLDALPDSRITACSPLYRSPAWGVTDQPDFLNAVVMLETYLSPPTLLAHTQRLEKKLGRLPSRRWGERLIDIDILLYGQHVVITPELRIPHPYLTQRIFALRPLLDIAPNVHIPGHGSAATLWQKLQTGSPHKMEKLDTRLW